MKWIVFVLGLALVVGGSAAMWQGYDIVEVERGWTSVISGTVALSAGVVTIALGIVVGRVDALRASLVVKLAEGPQVRQTDDRKTDDRSWHDSLTEAIAADLAVPSAPGAPVADVANDIANEEPIEPVLPEPVTTLPEEPAPPTVPADAVTDLPSREQPFEAPPVRAEAASLEGKPILRGWRAHSFGRANPLASAGAADAVPAKARRPLFAPPPIMSSKSLPRRGAWPPAPSLPATAEPEPAGIAMPQPEHEPPRSAPVSVEEKKGQYDWLEQALAGAEPKVESVTLRGDNTSETATPAPTVEHEAPSASFDADMRSNDVDEFDKAGDGSFGPVPPSSEPDLVSVSEPNGLAAAEAETPTEPAATDSSAAPAAPAVIGRYESNGASYVLYADGTIDATTPSGVFHFASMAELKVFIEGKR